MRIKQLKLKNFKSFGEAELNFGQINVISGFNKDNASGNGAGKTALIEALIFALYGAFGTNLGKMVRKGKNGCSVALKITDKGKTYDIERKYPSKLTIKEDGKDKGFVTPTLGQHFVDNLFSNYDFFKKFRVFDKGKGINILEFGPVKIKKTLMGFLDDVFEDARQHLLDQQREREDFNIDKKVYKHYPSTRRLEILKEGLKQFESDIDYQENKEDDAKSDFSLLLSEIQIARRLIKQIEKDKKILSENRCPLCEAEITNKKRNSLYKKKDSDIDKYSEDIRYNEKKSSRLKRDISKLKDKLGWLSDERWKIQKLITALETCLKFKDYRWTDKDVLLYKEAIKVLDNFAGYYINRWIKDLEAIINSYIMKMDMELRFELERGNLELKIKRKGQFLDYDMLSSGEKMFLSCIFKLAILLNKGKTGLILIDEGIDCLDSTNIIRLVEVIRDMPIQLILISQHDEVANSDIGNTIQVIKEDGISRLEE